MDDSISITLTRTQVSHIVRQASVETGVVAVLSGLSDNSKLAEAYNSTKDLQKLSRTLLTGLIVLQCFPKDGKSLGVNQVADIIGIGTSTTHRYLATLLTAGLLERNPKTRRYHLPIQQSEDTPTETSAT